MTKRELIEALEALDVDDDATMCIDETQTRARRITSFEVIGLPDGDGNYNKYVYICNK